jgi:1,4-dihydroxy-2-naphthoyl-CoA hydrolase
VISDEAGRRVCTARLTCMLRDVRPGDGQHVGVAG